MKLIATIQADLLSTPLGTRSRLLDELVGVPVLRRTLERVRRVKGVHSIHLLCPLDQRERCGGIAEALGVRVHPYDAPPAPWAALVQAARKWSLDGWRGGIGGTTSFDEFTDARLLHGLMRETQADAVFSVPPSAVILDPTLAEAMVERYAGLREGTRMMFAQTPPGLSGIVLDASLVSELAEKNIPVGWVFNYKPDVPQKDLIFQPCCFEVPPEGRYAVGRLLADTERSMERLTELLRSHENPDLVTAGRWLLAREGSTTERLPREVEIELTTDDPYPDTLLRPRGGGVEPRGPMDVDKILAIARELSAYDDSLIVLGGFGDPIRHPRFGEVLGAVRAVREGTGGVYGVAVRSAGVDLSDAAIDALIAHQVDVLEVTLDAWTPSLYARLQSPNDPAGADLEAVLARLDRLAEVRQRGGGSRPIVLPHLTKARENVAELDDFHDGWIRRLGAVVIAGYSRHAGTMPDRAVINMTPSPREACRRIRSRCIVLADGRVTLCDQDVNGRHAVGCVGERSLGDIWCGSAFGEVREAHRRGDYQATPVCAACDEWHRP